MEPDDFELIQEVILANNAYLTGLQENAKTTDPSYFVVGPGKVKPQEVIDLNTEILDTLRDDEMTEDNLLNLIKAFKNKRKEA